MEKVNFTLKENKSLKPLIINYHDYMNGIPLKELNQFIEKKAKAGATHFKVYEGYCEQCESITEDDCHNNWCQSFDYDTTIIKAIEYELLSNKEIKDRIEAAKNEIKNTQKEFRRQRYIKLKEEFE